MNKGEFFQKKIQLCDIIKRFCFQDFTLLGEFNQSKINTEGKNNGWPSWKCEMHSTANQIALQCQMPKSSILQSDLCRCYESLVRLLQTI